MQELPVYELESVFNEAAYPEVTFVRPKEFAHLKSSFKARGKHVTVSGPSGTGKTTLVRHVIRELAIPAGDILWINARQYASHSSALGLLGQVLGAEPTFEALTELLQLVKFTVIDDFHHLHTDVRLEIARTLKLWHENQVRFIVIGISASAQELYGTDPELGIRNDPFEIREQDATFTRTLIDLGTTALNIRFSDNLVDQIVAASNGVPSVVQVICKACCLDANIERTSQDEKTIDHHLHTVRQSVLRVFNAKYMSKIVGLAKGKRRARAVHNTYFDILATIARDARSEIPTESLYRDIVGVVGDPAQRKRKATSFYNCLNNLSDVIKEQQLEDTILYRASTVSIEDPTFRFYLNLVDMADVRKRVAVRSDTYPYDVAVSFASDARSLAEPFVRALQGHGLSVFYDFDQQALLWGQDLRIRLAQVYSTEALFMVVFLSEKYPERDWPEFEFSMGKAAAQKRTAEYILPLIVDDVKVIGLHDSVGHIDLRKVTIERAADVLAEKVVAAVPDDTVSDA